MMNMEPNYHVRARHLPLNHLLNVPLNALFYWRFRRPLTYVANLGGFRQHHAFRPFWQVAA